MYKRRLYVSVRMCIAKRILVGSESGGVTKNYHFVCFFPRYLLCCWLRYAYNMYMNIFHSIEWFYVLDFLPC